MAEVRSAEEHTAPGIDLTGNTDPDAGDLRLLAKLGFGRSPLDALGQTIDQLIGAIGGAGALFDLGQHASGFGFYNRRQDLGSAKVDSDCVRRHQTTRFPIIASEP